MKPGEPWVSVEWVGSSWEMRAAAQTLSMLGGARVDKALLHPRPVSQSSKEGGSPCPWALLGGPTSREVFCGTSTADSRPGLTPGTQKTPGGSPTPFPRAGARQSLDALVLAAIWWLKLRITPFALRALWGFHQGPGGEGVLFLKI